MTKTEGSGAERAGATGTDRRIRTSADLDGLRFGGGSGGSLGSGDSGDGAAAAGPPLIPVITQDAVTGDVLMLAWADRAALERTLATGEMHYWSRSRSELWHKGGTSGNTQRLLSLHADCDGDTVLALVDPAGPACHTNERTCFGVKEAASGAHWLDALWATLEARAGERPEGSYTTRLLDDENLRLKKLGEETAELIHALAKGEEERIPEEMADLLYHMLVALLASGRSPHDIEKVLLRRR